MLSIFALARKQLIRNASWMQLFFSSSLARRVRETGLDQGDVVVDLALFLSSLSWFRMRDNEDRGFCLFSFPFFATSILNFLLAVVFYELCRGVDRRRGGMVLSL